MLILLSFRCQSLSTIPEIPTAEMTWPTPLQPLSSGAYADVFACKWNNQPVAVKKIRLNPNSDEMKSLKMETSLAISLLHPNIGMYRYMYRINSFFRIQIRTASKSYSKLFYLKGLYRGVVILSVIRILVSSKPRIMENVLTL